MVRGIKTVLSLDESLLGKLESTGYFKSYVLWIRIDQIYLEGQYGLNRTVPRKRIYQKIFQGETKKTFDGNLQRNPIIPCFKSYCTVISIYLKLRQYSMQIEPCVLLITKTD